MAAASYPCAKPECQDFSLSCLPLWDSNRNINPGTSNERPTTNLATNVCFQVKDLISPSAERLKALGISMTWQRRRDYFTSDVTVAKVNELISRDYRATENGDGITRRRRENRLTSHARTLVQPTCSSRIESETPGYDGFRVTYSRKL